MKDITHLKVKIYSVGTVAGTEWYGTQIGYITEIVITV